MKKKGENREVSLRELICVSYDSFQMRYVLVDSFKLVFNTDTWNYFSLLVIITHIRPALQPCEIIQTCKRLRELSVSLKVLIPINWLINPRIFM